MEKTLRDFVIRLLNNPKLTNKLLERLDKHARDYDSYEYGLPTYDPELAKMREVVYQWLIDLDSMEK